MQPSLRRPGFELVVASFVVLFQELALIRWLSAQVRVLAYFPNLVLVSAFLGLGVGSLLAGRASLLWLWPLALVLLTLAAVGLSRVAFTHEASSEHLFLLYYDLPDGAPVVEGVWLPIVLVFGLTALCFVPLGQLVAERLNRFAARGRTLWGYCFDLLGSLLGVVAFAAASFANAFPWTWFAAFLAPVAIFFPRRSTRVAYALLALVLVGAVWAVERAQHYSPYYAIDVLSSGPGRPDFQILTNGSLHQHALPLRRDDPPLSAEHAVTVRGYHEPYRILGRPPGRVLVLGAGTGNDVAVLLDRGARSIDAVEIDPVILSIGRERHPNAPYRSPRVRVWNEDARSFLNDAEGPYDLIVFGTLDSLTRLSALSNVRLDNFVYTLDCLRAARRLLAEDGGIVLYFAVATDYIHAHLVAMLAETFGELPHFRVEDFRLFNYIYLAGPAFSHLPPHPRAVEERYFAETLPTLSVPDDDWPYLYLAERGVSGFYLGLVLGLGLLATLAVLAASPEMRAGLARGRGVDLEMFLFGAAFLLLETKFVTATNLLWGATWLTSAVVFGSILATVLLGTVWMQLRPWRFEVAAAGLLLALLATSALAPQQLLALHGPARLLASALYVGAPILFAAACFALRFRLRPRASLAFGWNLLGAVAGGLLEFLSMAFGLRALTALAALAYLGVIALARRRPAAASPAA